jgi:gliding motility associated protien GldN
MLRIPLFVFLLAVMFGGIPALVEAQVPTSIKTESTEPAEQADEDKPLDDIVERKLTHERRVLPYEPVREGDIFWEKRIWRVIDIREKMNKSFAYPEKPFIKILMDAAVNGEINVYGTEDDKFSTKLDPNEAAAMGSAVDTITTFDPETYKEEIKIVRNDLNPEDIKRFRIKEVWFFDSKSSSLKVRILGIAPLREVYDDNGNFRYEQPMFWIYYPDARKVFAKEIAYNPWNNASPMTWEDIFEMRFFSSYIYKASNEYDRRLEDYLSGVDLLLESDKIQNEIFNFEQDLWEY